MPTCPPAGTSPPPTKPNILVYVGQGSSRRAVEHTFRALHEAAPQHRLVSVTHKALTDPQWFHHAALMVLPGGRDALYVDALAGTPAANVRNFVHRGGKYLGLCAGAYYAAARIAFAPDQPHAVRGPRPLGFYPGLCRGPVTPTFDYDDTRGAAALPYWPGGHPAYYHGGGTFVDAAQHPSVAVLHTYDAEGNLPATVACQVGHGMAVLTGLHLEYDGTQLGDGYPAGMVAALAGANPQRQAVFAQLIDRLLVTP